jgi:cytochrome c peroxidase
MRQAVPLAILSTCAALCVACVYAATGQEAAQTPHLSSPEESFELETPLGLPKMQLPEDNPLTREKVELGKQLYFDPRLSRDDTVSCATCHDPAKGWSNGERFATGVRDQVGGRSAPSIINAGYNLFQFWDGRAKHVEGQALGPIQNPIEMDLTLEELVEKLNQIEGYRTQFQAVFGTDVTAENIAKAIGAFERTILSGNTPYDRHKAGDENALSDAAKRGMDVFFNEARCSSCHREPHFTDGAFHNIGVGVNDDKVDVGRFEHSKLLGDRGSFKTPTLREIARSAPYMHDGRFATLAEVVEYYDKGGEPNPQLDEEIFPLELTDQQKKDLITFLEEGLSSPNYPMVEAPTLP